MGSVGPTGQKADVGDMGDTGRTGVQGRLGATRVLLEILAPRAQPGDKAIAAKPAKRDSKGQWDRVVLSAYLVRVVLLVKPAPRVIRVQLAEWAPWAELVPEETLAPLVFKAQMDFRGSWARKAQEAPLDPEEIRAPLDKLGQEARQAPAATAVILATQEERAPMALLAVVVQRVQEATQAQPD